MKVFSLIIALGMLVSFNAFGDDNTHKCTESAINTFDRLNALLVKSGYQSLSFDPSKITNVPKYDFSRKINILELQTASGPFVDCLPDSGDVLALDSHIPYKQGSSYDHPPSPTWNKERAVALARAYVQAVFKEFPADAGTPQINFAPTSEFPKYYEGVWHIRWPRVDKEGHVFIADSLDVFLSETKGLRYASLNYFSKYQEPIGPLISQNEAVKLSGPAAENLLHSKLTVPWGLNGLRLADSKSVLWIVNPNHIFQWKSINDAASAADTTAKLAWWVEYKTTSGSASASGHLIDIWIDAQTKKVLGGDFK